MGTRERTRELEMERIEEEATQKMEVAEMSAEMEVLKKQLQAVRAELDEERGKRQLKRTTPASSDCKVACFDMDDLERPSLEAGPHVVHSEAMNQISRCLELSRANHELLQNLFRVQGLPDVGRHPEMSEPRGYVNGRSLECTKKK